MWTLVGQHKGTVTSLLSVGTAAGPEVAKGLLLSGSADTTIKVWLVKAGELSRVVLLLGSGNDLEVEAAAAAAAAHCAVSRLLSVGSASCQ